MNGIAWSVQSFERHAQIDKGLVKLRLADEHVIRAAVTALEGILDRIVTPSRLWEVWNAIEIQLNILAGLDYNQYPAITDAVVPAIQRLQSQLQTEVGLSHHALPLSWVISVSM